MTRQDTIDKLMMMYVICASVTRVGVRTYPTVGFAFSFFRPCCAGLWPLFCGRIFSDSLQPARQSAAAARSSDPGRVL